jgi:uncharacterized membrane protein YphA (DoxX/SURF4 family)
MNPLTKIFLVLLRLAIGWHFLFEGVEKLQSVALGPTEYNRPWSSGPYLREATGPIGGWLRQQAGDPDEDALARLTVPPLPPGQDPAQTPPYTRLPPALDKEWNDYFERFVGHFQHVYEPLKADDLSPEERQGKDPKAIEQLLAQKNEARKKAIDRKNDLLIGRAEATLKQRKAQTVQWLLTGKKVVKETFPAGTVEVERTTPQRVEKYRAKLAEVRDIQARKLPAFGQDVEKDRLRAAKAELNRMRAELLAELGNETAEMKKALEQVAFQTTDSDSWPNRLVIATVVPRAGLPVNLALAGVSARVPEPAGNPRVEWIDRVTSYGLTIVGACLLLGLFSRTACVAGAAFLLLFYLAMPPFPWLPENLKTEGHYLFVNKNLIEMLALFVLATTRSGRWAGLDGLVQFLNPFRWRRRNVPTDEAELRERHGSRADEPYP